MMPLFCSNIKIKWLFVGHSQEAYYISNNSDGLLLICNEGLQLEVICMKFCYFLSFRNIEKKKKPVNQ